MTNDGTISKILTFDNMMLLPGRSSVLPRDVNLTMRLTRDLTMNIPLLSAAMDTVTEARLAIAPAQEGGGAARGWGTASAGPCPSCGRRGEMAAGGRLPTPVRSRAP